MEHAARPPASAAAADLTGRVLGDFRILRRLGQGGMGQVYLAEQTSLKRKVAIKVLKAELAADAVAAKRFQAEAEAVARVTHANIVGVYAVHEQDGLQYMVLEYVEGWNLRQYVERKGPLEVVVAFSIMRQVAAALQRAAEAGLIHRDIKPENILLTRKGEAKVADFGLSRCLEGTGQNLTESGLTVGTPMYMSPEQVQGEALDPRSDIYSFGASCYFMLSGRAPFQGQTAIQVALQQVQAQPHRLGEIRPDLPADLCALVEGMMAKRREDRYQAARDVIHELARIREGLSGTLKLRRSATVAPWRGHPLKAKLLGAGWPRLRWLAAAAGAAALAAGTFIGWHGGRAVSGALAPALATARADEQANSFVQEEERLLQEIRRTELGGEKKTAAAEDPTEAVRYGLEARLRLIVLYLDEWRLDDAARFVQGQITSSVPAYQVFGRLGKAAVLSFQDRPGESNEGFVELFGEKKLIRQHRVKVMLVNRNRRFHLLIVDALDRNEANGAKPPADLSDLRKPQPFAPLWPAGQHRNATGKGP